MKKQVLFNMTEQERRGFLVLLLLLVLLSSVPFFFRLFRKEMPEPVPELSWVDYDEGLNDQKQSFLSKDDVLDVNQVEKDAKKTIEKQLFYFNPNDLPEDKWRALGFSDKQIRVIKNYEAKGGKFYDAADVAKIYSISDHEFQRIAPYLQFPPKSIQTIPKNKQHDVRDRKVKAVANVDLNSADTTALKTLHGIGSVLSARIVKFRERLGGFHSIEQLKEVYGLPKETYEQIKVKLVIADPEVKRLPINRLSEEELAEHPYCSRKIAKLIIRYRDQHGAFDAISDLKNIYTLDAEFLRKIEPYLNFN